MNVLHVSPFRLLYYSAVLNGMISPVLLFIVTQIASNRKIMKSFTNSKKSTAMGWTLCAFMTLALIAFLV